MFSPFYFVFGPLGAIVVGAVWFLFFSISRDETSDLRKRSWRVQSDLEKAQEMERLEAEAEMAAHATASKQG